MLLAPCCSRVAPISCGFLCECLPVELALPEAGLWELTYWQGDISVLRTLTIESDGTTLLKIPPDALTLGVLYFYLVSPSGQRLERNTQIIDLSGSVVSVVADCFSATVRYKDDRQMRNECSDFPIDCNDCADEHGLLLTPETFTASVVRGEVVEIDFAITRERCCQIVELVRRECRRNGNAGPCHGTFNVPSNRALDTAKIKIDTADFEIGDILTGEYVFRCRSVKGVNNNNCTSSEYFFTYAVTVV